LSTWGVYGTTPLADWGDVPLADRFYNYLRAKWALTGDLAQAKLPTVNRPNPGRAGYWIYVSEAGGDSGRTYTESYVQPNLGTGAPIPFKGTMRIRFFSKRPTQGLTFSELNKMVDEAGRIAYQYYADPGIVGIVAIDRYRWGESTEASQEFGKEFRNIYKIDALVDVHYAKQSNII
jgi:hypothetical protein